MSVPSGAKGSGLAIRQPDRITWDPSKGLVRYKVYASIDADDIEVLAAEARTWSQPYTIRSSGTTHTIEIETSESTGTGPVEDIVPIDRWEMPANEIQKTIWEHNKLLEIPTEAVNLAKKYVDDGKSWDDLVEEEVDLLATLTETQMLDLAEAFDLASRQQDHFPLGQYVLRHVTNVAAGYNSNVSDSNVERLYTTEQLLAEVTDPVWWTVPLPPRLVYKIEHLAAPTARTGFLWSWRKLPSAESTAANGRIEISTEYWLEQWSTWLYGLAT